MFAWVSGLVELFVRMNKSGWIAIAKTVIFGLILLGIFGAFIYQELSRRSLLADKRAVETKLAEAQAETRELETERDQLRSALSTIERQRKISLDTVATLKVEQKQLRTNLADIRTQLKQSTDRERRCLDALHEAQKYFPR